MLSELCSIMSFMVKSFIPKKNKQKLCGQQLNSFGGFIFLLRKNNKRQISYVLKFKCDLFSPPNPQSFIFVLRSCGQRIIIFSNIHFLSY